MKIAITQDQASSLQRWKKVIVDEQSTLDALTREREELPALITAVQREIDDLERTVTASDDGGIDRLTRQQAKLDVLRRREREIPDLIEAASRELKLSKGRITGLLEEFYSVAYRDVREEATRTLLPLCASREKAHQVAGDTDIVRGFLGFMKRPLEHTPTADVATLLESLAGGTVPFIFKGATEAR